MSEKTHQELLMLMTKDQTIFVPDTNILVSFPGIIPGFGERSKDENGDIIAGNHIVIPNAVLGELNRFKHEIGNERGFSSREIGRKLREFICSNVPEGEACYSLNHPVPLNDGHGTILSILSVGDYRKSGNFAPDKDDMDGQIILTALKAKEFITREEDPILGKEVILVTNDNYLAMRAWTKGLKTITYGYKPKEPYTGRRVVEVPLDLIHRFIADKFISLALWQELLPNEPPLVANEFVRFSCSEWTECSHDEKFQFIARYHAKHPNDPRLVSLQHVNHLPYGIRPRSDGQAMVAELMMLPADEVPFVIIQGTYGTGKTFLSTAIGMYNCENGLYDEVFIVPPDHTLGAEKGFLPGDLDEKMLPEIQPILDSLLALKKLRGGHIDKKNKNGNGNEEKPKNIIRKDIMSDFERYFEVIPLLYARGRNLSDRFVILDEFQNMDRIQTETLIGRIAKGTKAIIVGDPHQIHGRKWLNAHHNGLTYASRLLYDDPLVGQVTLFDDEIERSDAVRLFAERLKNHQN